MKILEDFFSKANGTSLHNKTFFIYDLDRVKDNVETLRRLFKNMDQIYFSVKSNPSPILLKNLSAQNVCFDVSSAVELTKAFRASSNYSKITISGPAKTNAFIKAFSKLKIQSVHLDSKEEYELLKKEDLNLSIRWPLESSYSQKVGLPASDLEFIVADATKRRKLSGIHIYIGRERAQADLVSKSLQQIKNFVLENQKSFIERPKLFWGGGMPTVNHVESDFFPQDSFFETHLECGRALVHNAGYYVTQILEVKEKQSERIIILNGGLQHLATHFGSPRFGQQDVTTFFPSHTDSKTSKANIYGSLGTTTDILIRELEVPNSVKRGDWVAIGPAGSYGYFAGTNQFLGPHAVTEIFYENGRTEMWSTDSLNYLEAGVYAYTKA